MNTDNLSKWVDELQAQIDNIKRSVSGATAGTADKAKNAITPFIDFSNETVIYLTEEDDGVVSYEATYDCAMICCQSTEASYVTGKTLPGGSAERLVIGDTGVLYLKAGMIGHIEGSTTLSTYYVIAPLYVNITPTPKPATRKRSTKKK